MVSIRDADKSSESTSSVASTAENAAPANARPACFKSTLQEIACVFVLTMGVAQSSLASGACQIITTLIGADLGMTSGQIPWINAANNIIAGSFLM